MRESSPKFSENQCPLARAAACRYDGEVLAYPHPLEPFSRPSSSLNAPRGTILPIPDLCATEFQFRAFSRGFSCGNFGKLLGIRMKDALLMCGLSRLDSRKLAKKSEQKETKEI